jgi:hypothetical protein
MDDMVISLDVRFAHPASRERLVKVAAALERTNIAAFVLFSHDEARAKIRELIPEGAEVFTAMSRTLDELGIAAELDESGRYNAVRPKLVNMDRERERHAMRELGAPPGCIVGSVHAVTEDGVVIVASMSSSQLGPYASGAGKVVWAVGAQKIVKNIELGFERIEDYSLPREDERMRGLYGIGSQTGKILIVKREVAKGRSSVILLNDAIGF